MIRFQKFARLHYQSCLDNGYIWNLISYCFLLASDATKLFELIVHWSKSLTTKPDLGLGSNHVHLGGMVSFASATLSRSSITIGSKQKAAILSYLQRVSKPSNPREPPTKSTRLSLRTSVIPRMLLRTFSPNICTSRFATTFPLAASARISCLTSHVYH